MQINKVEIRIVFDGNNVLVNGPIQDKIMCLGMIELAKQIILHDTHVNSLGNRNIKLDIIPPPPNGNHPA